MAFVSRRFALLFLQIALFIAYCDASISHSGRRHSLHVQSRRSTCPRRNHFKKLAEAQGLAQPAQVSGNSTVDSGNTSPSGTPEATTSSSSSISSSESSPSSSSAAAASSTGNPAPTPSSSSSSARPAPTSPSSRLSNLFPVGGYSKSWTTCPDADNSLPLEDGTLNPIQILRSVPHAYERAPDGRKAMMASFPQGSYTFAHQPQGGFSFYAPGPPQVDLTSAKEATFGYAVYFPDGFAFNKGGKLPGFYGGNSDDEATNCSGGRRDTACFSARLMWREDGDGEMYTYLPPGFDANDKVCDIPPHSDCNPTYGASIARGSFKFARGAWTTVAERVKLNDVGKSNGELQLWVNGRSVIDVKGVVLRDSGAGKLRGIQFQTFFGGSTSDWASPKNQEVYFSDLSVAILDTF